MLRTGRVRRRLSGSTGANIASTTLTQQPMLGRRLMIINHFGKRGTALSSTNKHLILFQGNDLQFHLNATMNYYLMVGPEEL
jgi:hypothetical protein